MTNRHLAENEVVVKEYHVSRMERPKADGVLVVTNRRMLFLSEQKSVSGHGLMTEEVQLSDVAGVSGYIGSSLSIARLILIGVLAFVLLLLGLHVHAMLILLLLPAYLFYRVFQGYGRGSQITLLIHTRSVRDAGISVVTESSGGLMGLLGRVRPQLGVVLGPGPDAETALRELGAVVLDLQTLGDHAVEKWVASTHMSAVTAVSSSTTEPSQGFFSHPS